MRKKSYTARLGALAVALTVITTSLMGGTLAKYTSEVTGTGTATVAKWAIKAGDIDGGTAINTFALGEKDSGVADGKIAPGTKGELPVYIDLTGTEVAAEVKVTLKVDKVDNLPTNFAIKDSEGQALTLSDGTEVEVYKKTLTAAEAGKLKENANITWEWPFDTANGDVGDTTNGVTPPTANFTVKVTATQLDTDPTTPAP